MSGKKNTNSACRSMLYMPGNNPGMLQHAAVFGADSVLFDLEDAVSEREKDAARRLVSHFVKDVDFGKVIVTVRINGADTPYFERDLKEIVPSRPAAVRVPKCHSPEDVTRADELMSEIERANNMPLGSVKIHAMLETAHGIEHAYDIAVSSPRIEALTLGGQDLTADLGVQKTRGGVEFLYARGRIVMAAKAAGLSAFDTVWTDLNDIEGLKNEAALAVQIGFTGKAAVHPSQVDAIHEAYRPDTKELRRAFRIVAGAEAAEREGKGVISVDGRMVDGPIVTRAFNLINLASLYGIEKEDDLT
ncbi:citrate lyase [Synergistales bacterium]|nr:citrate lyase [Synergistales bacterium]